MLITSAVFHKVSAIFPLNKGINAANTGAGGIVIDFKSK
jgi:hypothetical protein